MASDTVSDGTNPEIETHRAAIVSFIRESIANIDAGTEVTLEPVDLELPTELVQRFDEVDGLREAWERLTPGRQRGFVLHISGAKQSTTRFARVDKHTSRILNGMGMHDCVCGRSARMPRCDGSHSKPK